MRSYFAVAVLLWAQFCKIYSSQHRRCGGSLNDSLVPNFLQCLPVKEFRTLNNTWRKYGQRLVACFLDSRCIRDETTVDEIVSCTDKHNIRYK